ncbi:MAG: hypothetical protein JNK48_21190 [Bryobacterales bacterium]|nr:hypothetical protein [Bryobacterales bacterium]
MMLPLLLLLAQSGLDLPPAGYFPARDGRIYPLYGMRGNLVLGEPLEEGVTSAIRMDGVTAASSAAGVRVGGEFIGAEQLRENRILTPRIVWLAEPARLAERKPRIVIVAKADGVWQRIEYEGGTLAERDRQAIAAGSAALDSDGRLWTASERTVSCGERTWEMETAVETLHALSEGWVLIRAGERLYAAQCRHADLTVVPEPEP